MNAACPSIVACAFTLNRNQRERIKRVLKFVDPIGGTLQFDKPELLDAFLDDLEAAKEGWAREQYA